VHFITIRHNHKCHGLLHVITSKLRKFSYNILCVCIGLVHTFVRFCLRRLFPSKNCMLAMYLLLPFSCIKLFWDFPIWTNGTKFSRRKLWSAKLRKTNISHTFFFTSSIEAPKLQRPPKTFVPSTEKTTDKRTAQKWFARFKQGGHIMHLVGYGEDYPLWTAWEEPDRHC
jgi:hypothetical protein